METMLELKVLRDKFRSVIEKLADYESKCQMAEKACVKEIRKIVEDEIGVTYEEVMEGGVRCF